VAGFCECGDEPSGYTKCGEFLEDVTTSQEGLCPMELVLFDRKRYNFGMNDIYGQ
jgi:hypothetical protein